MYEKEKHYGQHIHFKSDHLPVLICSKSKKFGSLQRGTGNILMGVILCLT